jgi:hypothetical protein
MSHRLVAYQALAWHIYKKEKKRRRPYGPDCSLNIPDLTGDLYSGGARACTETGLSWSAFRHVRDTSFAKSWIANTLPRYALSGHWQYTMFVFRKPRGSVVVYAAWE